MTTSGIPDQGSLEPALGSVKLAAMGEEREKGKI